MDWIAAPRDGSWQISNFRSEPRLREDHLDFDRDGLNRDAIERSALGGAYRCTIISDPRRLKRLERAWSALYRAAEAPHLSDSFEWAWLSWNLVCAPRGRQLSCAVVWRSSRILAILPLAVSRRGPWCLARPLTSESTEYCPYLIDSSARPEDVFEAMLSALRRHGVDAVRFNWARDDGALGRWLATRSDAVRTLTLPSTEVRFRAFGEWNRYRGQLAHRVRTHLHRARQRAAKLGELAFVEVTEPAERAAVWRWMIEHKRRWLARRDLDSHWLGAPEYERFMLKSLEVFGPERMRIFALKLNGAVIAADLCNIGGARLEQFFNVFDDGYKHIGPGNLLREYCTQWAFARGMDYDLRPGRQPYKHDWASEVAAVSDYTVPLTWLGRRFLVSLRAYRWLAARIAAMLRSLTTGLGAGPMAPARCAYLSAAVAMYGAG
jgi:CelD/BcsL family acetyltransferase involved in cellulose biosynthesis